MYLISINSIAYFVITIFFAIIFLCAYINRRNNSTSNQFLGIGVVSSYKIIKEHFGLIEFTLLTTLGAKFGLSGFYYLIIAIIIAKLVWVRYDTTLNHSTFALFVRSKSNLTLSILVAIYQLLAYIGLITLTIIIMASMCKSLLGWSFVNSIFGLVGFTIVYIIVGGYKSVKINKIISYTLFFIIVLMGLVFIAIKSSTFYDIYINLGQLALSKSLPLNYYTSFIFSLSSLHIIAILVIGVVGLNILYNKVSTIKITYINWISLLAKLILIFCVVLLGICAIGTKANTVYVGGKEVVTYQAQLSNGEMGYVVKTIDKTQKNSSAMGILPLQTNQADTQVESNQYNYLLSGVVTLRHYLPNSIAFLIIIGLMALFIASISQYLLHGSRIIVKNIAQPLGWLKQYEDLGVLWLSRVSIIALIVLGLLCAYFMLPYFSFLPALLLFFAIFMVPLFIILILLSFL